MQYDFITAKREYRELCNIEKSINVYMQAWFLDAVCDSSEEWKVILVKEDQDIIAAFPFQYIKVHGFWRICNPWSAAFLGVWMKTRNYESKKQELLINKMIVDIINERLPYFDEFKICFSPEYKNWQPFYWNGFTAIPFYTMSIVNYNLDVKTGFGKNCRKKVNKAIRSYSIYTDNISLEDYWNFFEKSYVQRERSISYSKEKFIKLVSAAIKNNSCQIRTIEKDSQVVAVNIILEDEKRCYNQFGTQLKSEESGATSFAVFDAITYAQRKEKIFDFEGSMIQGVCEFYSGFNPDWEHVYVITKKSKRYQLWSLVRDLVKNGINRN